MKQNILVIIFFYFYNTTNNMGAEQSSSSIEYVGIEYVGVKPTITYIQMLYTINNKQFNPIIMTRYFINPQNTLKFFIEHNLQFKDYPYNSLLLKKIDIIKKCIIEKYIIDIEDIIPQINDLYTNILKFFNTITTINKNNKKRIKCNNKIYYRDSQDKIMINLLLTNILLPIFNNLSNYLRINSGKLIPNIVAEEVELDLIIAKYSLSFEYIIGCILGIPKLFNE